MNIAQWLIGLFIPTPAAQPVAIPDREQLTPKPLVIAPNIADALRPERPKADAPFRGLPTPPPGVRPAYDPPRKGMAMDDALTTATIGGALGAWVVQGMWGEGLFFPGYPYLAELSQRPEYRHIVETLAEQMTRKWIKLQSTGDTDKSDKITALDAAMKRFNMREAFHRAAELDGYMGMGMIYLDLDGAGDNPEEIRSPLLTDDQGVLKSAKIAKGSLRGFVPVDPTWVSPKNYNSIDPLKPDFMVPSSWYVMGKEVHCTRLLIFRSREVPDILKAGYNFGGMSMSQMAKPYVDNWLRTRQSVSDLLHSFTVFVWKLNLGSLLQNAQQLGNRIAAFVLGRDNKGLFMVDKETEEFESVSAPLGTLDKLQAQAQEQMSSVSQTPLVWLLGISPTGLNPTADGEIRVFYDRVRAKQEKIFGPNITTALQVLQLNEFGSIDPEIGHEFPSLWELDDAGKSAVQKTKADSDAVYLSNGVISAEEVRDRLAADPESPYHGLKGPPPDPPDDGTGGGEANTYDPAERIDSSAEEGSTSGANSGV